MAGSGQVIANMFKWVVEKKAGIEAVAKITDSQMQNYARTNRRWQDRTGNARAGLNGGSYWETMNILKIYIAHSMEYGPFLELSKDRRFAILEESRDKFKDSFYNGVKRIMEH